MAQAHTQLQNAQKEILSVMDRLLTLSTKDHLDSALPANAQPLLVTIQNPSNVTPLMHYTYERHIRPVTLDTEGQNLVKIAQIPHIKPIPDIEWPNRGSSSVIPDWGDLGLYMWHVSGGHTVILVNLHHIKYSRFIYTLQVLKVLTVGRAQSRASQQTFAGNVMHIVIQHLECLPDDNAIALLSIIETTTMAATNGQFRYYLFSGVKVGWKQATWQKLKGICRHIRVAMNMSTNDINIDNTALSTVSWSILFRYLDNDIVKTIILYQQMPPLPILTNNNQSNLISAIEQHVYLYLVGISPIYKCLDKFFCRSAFIRTMSYQKHNRVTKQECADLFQAPMLLANNLIGAGYSIPRIIQVCNHIAHHISKYGGTSFVGQNISQSQVIDIVGYGSELLMAGLDIDKPVMALVDYFQKIINLFSPIQ